jgi:cellulose synthase/poly-beta-1,6-N-acetylglucosamine synthase-like glycosyltransferase
MDLTAIIACKNRDRNIRYCISSISYCDPRPRVILVDFGSLNSHQYLQERFGDWVQVIRVNHRINPFHKARALNIALRKTKSTFICSTDCDQIYATNFFGVVQNQLKMVSKRIILCKSYFLRRVPEWLTDKTVSSKYEAALKLAKAGKKPHGEGCCTALPTKWLKNVGGWDEEYIGYGAEDSDIILRANIRGFKTVHINSLTSTIHLPHPKEGGYYDKKAFNRNRRRYQTKRLSKQPIEANQGKTWGMIQ